MTSRRVLVVEPFSLTRHGLERLLDDAPDLTVAGATGSPEEALRLVHEAQPDAVVLELAYAEGGGLELIRSLRAAAPSLPLLVVTQQDGALHAERALRAGANGFVSKREELPVVLSAIRTVLAGGTHVDADVAAGGPPTARLTERELEVLEHLGRGLRSREIALAMGLSEKTIEGYRAQLRAKLGLPDAATLLQHAIRWVKLDRA